jgi:hypothetical protein
VNPHARIPGTHYEIHAIRNLALFAGPLWLITFLARFGAGLYIPVFLLRRHLDPFLGRGLLWFGIPLLLSALLLGRLKEHRVVIEFVPILWLSCLQAINAWSTVSEPDRNDAAVTLPEGTIPAPGLQPVTNAGTSATRSTARRVNGKHVLPKRGGSTATHAR